MAVTFDREQVNSGYNLSKINTNFQRIEEALEDAISRSGENPNTMEADLDLNNNDLLNGGVGNFTNIFVDGVDVHDLTGTQGPQGEQGPPGADGLGVPAGGTTGQVLKKASNADNDTVWATDAEGIGGSTGSTDNRLLRSDGTGGATLQSSAITVDDSGNMSGVGTINGYTPREVLTANRTYYIRSDGSDSNTGLANTSGGAFLTVQKAIDTAYGLDLNGFNVMISVGAGTYTGANTISSPWVGKGSVSVVGAGSTTIISTTGASCFRAEGFGVTITLQNMKLQTTTSGVCIQTIRGAVIRWSGIEFGVCAGFHVEAVGQSQAYAFGDYTISGGAVAHLHANNYSSITVAGQTVTLTGTPAFSAWFAGVAFGNVTIASTTFVGSATGARYLAHKTGVIETAGAGATYFPGNATGSTATGGQYL
jgi:hypothetical protein